MTELFEPTGDHDARLALSATGVLAAFNRAGVLTAADVHTATRTAALGGETDESVVLALALAVRAVREGSVCLDVASVHAPDGLRELAPELPWPDAVAWRTALAASRLVAAGALRWEEPLLYLDRYHRLETQVAADLAARVTAPGPEVDERALAAALARVRGAHFSAEQEAAAVRAVRGWTTVLTGGPGTGKTTTVARMLVLLADQAAATGRRWSVALAAPTGKAATRLQEAVLEELAGLDPADRDRVGRPAAMTLHRLLGWRPDNTTRFRHDRTHRLGYDLVLVDESSMVELTMMARLLEAVRPQARLVLLGDPRQLTSVGAGAVLADVVRGFEAPADGADGADGAGGDAGAAAGPVAALTTNFRSTRRIRRLAEALRVGDADAVVDALRRPAADEDADEVEFVETDDPADAVREEALTSALAVRAAALAGDAAGAVAALDRHRLLCAHREGPYGVRHWNLQVERWLSEHVGEGVGAAAVGRPVAWYPGRPLLVTVNDHALQIYNGETGVVVPDAEGRPRAWIAGSERLRDFAPSRLDAVETMHAMTVHKAQGSQAEVVTVLLPESGSRLLTRELLYTAITRAQRRVRVVGTEAAVRAAVQREARRASGLAPRLRAAIAG